MPPGAGRAAAALMLQQPRPPGSLRLGGFAGMLPIPDFELLAPLDRGDIDRLGIMRNTLNERHDSTPCYTRRQNADVPFLFLRAGKARGEVCGSSKTVANAMPPSCQRRLASMSVASSVDRREEIGPARLGFDNAIELPHASRP